MLGRKLTEDLPVPFETYAASLEAIGLIENSPDLLLRLTRLYARQVVGFYDPAEKRFYIVPERSRDTGGPAGELMEQILLAHELTHALQDQRLGLDKRMRALRDSTDALLALQAVLEGEATLLMTEALMASVPGDAREALGNDPIQQILDGLDSPAAVEGAEGVPDFFVKELVFPYAAGTAWVRQKRKDGGWAAIDAVYRNLPSTTSEILRPGAVPGPRKRLVASDRPRPGRVPGGASKIWYDTLGEWALGSLLERAGAGDDAKEAAAGWQDDRVVFFAIEGITGRRRHGLSLEDSRREPRRGETDRDASRTALRQSARGRETFDHDPRRRRRGRPRRRPLPGRLRVSPGSAARPREGSGGAGRRRRRRGRPSTPPRIPSSRTSPRERW